MELAPILELADGIVDIVETGATLRENGLAPIEEVAQVSARLIVQSCQHEAAQGTGGQFIAQCEGI